MTESTDKPKPLLVPWTGYIGHLSAKTTLMLTGAGLSFVGIAMSTICLVALLIMVWLFISTLGRQVGGETVVEGLMYVFLSALFYIAGGFIGGLLVRTGLRTSKKAKNLKPVIPMTQNRVIHLPAEESLVRASSEPAQPQQEILLRPAHSSEETPSDQLLRPR